MVPLLALVLGSGLVRVASALCAGAPLSVGDEFIPRGGQPETVRFVAAALYGRDVVGYVYQSKNKKLYAQARSGMPSADQSFLKIEPIPDHKTGQTYRYSPIVPIKANPWRDLTVILCQK